jgi:membrane-bound lytic murein transglycosylase D
MLAGLFVVLVVVQTVVLGVRQSAFSLERKPRAEGVSQQFQGRPPLKVAQLSADEPKEISALLQETLPRFNIDPASVPLTFQEQVRKRVHEYSVLYHHELHTMLQRANIYLPMIKLVLKQHHLPSYFAFLPLVESAFEARAEHPVSGARGLWQLMPETARDYGLRVSSHVDERLDPFRATRAAARYLRELHDIFGADSPLLVLAAYNYGENNISKAIVRSRTRDIWSLFRKRQIPYETRDFLVKMVTLWILVGRSRARSRSCNAGTAARSGA